MNWRRTLAGVLAAFVLVAGLSIAPCAAVAEVRQHAGHGGQDPGRVPAAPGEAICVQACPPVVAARDAVAHAPPEFALSADEPFVRAAPTPDGIRSKPEPPPPRRG